MTLVVDTSVLIDHLRGDRRARGALRAAAERGTRIVGSVLTRSEIVSGMRDEERAATSILLDSLDWVEVDVDLADAAGALARRYVQSYPGIDVVDYVIAATAMRLDAELWTRNTKHFPMLAGLVAPY
jgi:predicted nucleic acid-binding protein